ncbi:MAG TPA: beta-propeller fold lactonase family protein [Pseudonocardiaceae bacterium]|nr:beta-propeller fold lactonase family protein [Pseudonocardiaceae bacterium]
MFISYRHGDDVMYVHRLSEHLANEGVSVWFDHEIVTGDRWDHVIRLKINTCVALVVVMTPQAEESEWVAREINQAELMNKPIFPLLLDGQGFFRLSNLQYEDVTGARMPKPSFVARLRAISAEESLPVAATLTRSPAAEPVSRSLVKWTKRMTTRKLPIAIGSFAVVAALLAVAQVGLLGTNTPSGSPPVSDRPDTGPSGRFSPRAQPPTAKVTDTITVGNRPLGVAVSPDGRHAYVTNYVSGTVSVIDTGNDAVVGAIPVGGNPAGVAISPDGHRAYITNDNSNTLSVIDTGNNVIIGTITVGDNPVSVAISPDGHRAYTTNNKSRTVSVINIDNSAVIGTVTVGNNPVGVAVSPDGRHVYVVNANFDSISVIDTGSNTITDTIVGLGTGPVGVAVSPDGRHAYVTNFASGGVSLVDIKTNAVTDTISSGGDGVRGVAVSPDGRRVYVTSDYYNTVSVIDTGKNAIIDTITVGSEPEGVAFSPDGRRAYVANARSGTVSVVKIGG